MQPLWYDLLHATKPDGQGWTIKGDEAFHRCLVCNATYPQTDEGWRALKEHGMNDHEQPTTFDWKELHGKTVTLAVVEREITDRYFPGKIVDLIARDEEGIVYFLNSEDCQPDYNGRTEGGGWKCKPKSNLLRLMQPEAE